MAKKEVVNTEDLTVRVGEDSAAAAVLDVTEKAIDVVGDTLEIAESAAEKVITVTKNNPYLIAGALVIGLGVGAFIGYKIAEKRLIAKFEAELDEQVAAAKAHYRRVSKDGTTPEEVLAERHPDFQEPPGEEIPVVREFQARGEQVPYHKVSEIPQPEPKEEVVVVKVDPELRSVWTSPKGESRDWDYKAEVAARLEKPNEPYVISHDEFIQNPEEHETVTLTYYSADDTLCDSRELPMDNVDGVIGEEALQRFGHGSGDPNVVYVCNENLDTKFEIVRSMGSYEAEVLSQPPTDTLQHSHRGSRRRRSADE